LTERPSHVADHDGWHLRALLNGQFAVATCCNRVNVLAAGARAG
jgi:hypothetical protein